MGADGLGLKEAEEKETYCLELCPLIVSEGSDVCMGSRSQAQHRSRAGSGAHRMSD